MIQAIRSGVFFVVMIVLTAVFATLVILSYPFPPRIGYGFAKTYAHWIMASLRFICNLRYVIEGQEHIPDQPSVVYLRHESMWETVVELTIFPRQCWVFKKELLWVPFFGWGIQILSPIAIDRSAGRSALRQVVKQGKEKLEEGVWVMIFPEGTRMAPDQRRRYGLSGAVLAVESDCAIVPVAHNAGDYWPKRGFIKKPGTIRLVIGKPIKSQGRTAEEVNEQAKAWIDDTVSKLRSG
ncbi:MAG: lysophospholipid acyltransferase family protein [Pseudomonadota bacterium]